MTDITAEQAAEALRLKREHDWCWRDIAVLVGAPEARGDVFLAAAMAARVPVSRAMLSRLDPDVRQRAVQWNAKVRREVRAGKPGSQEPDEELEAAGHAAEPRARTPMRAEVPQKRAKRWPKRR